MNKPTFKHICLMHIQQLTNFPYIEKDFDALTDYELLCKVVDYLNQVITNENEQNNNILALYNAFNELKNYVESFFDNLDVQDEINNKLDEMVEQGTLQEIIANYLNSKAIFGFDNVASMKEATNLINGSYARTFGYYEKNDNGSALYKIRTITNDDVVDEMFILEMANDNNLIAELIIENNCINLNQIGAKGNDSFINDSYIENALTYCKNNEVNKIIFNEGTYKINNSIVLDNTLNDIEICGVSSRKSLIKSDNVIIYVDIQSGSRHYIHDIGFIGSGNSAGQTAIGKSSADSVYVARQRLEHLYFYGITYGINIRSGYFDSPILYDFHFQTVQHCLSLKHCEGGMIQKMVAEPFIYTFAELYQCSACEVRDGIINGVPNHNNDNCAFIIYGSKVGEAISGCDVKISNIHSEQINQFALVLQPNTSFENIYIWNSASELVQSRNTFDFGYCSGIGANNCSINNLVYWSNNAKESGIYDFHTRTLSELSYNIPGTTRNINLSIGGISNLNIKNVTPTQRPFVVNIQNTPAANIHNYYEIQNNQYTLKNGNLILDNFSNSEENIPSNPDSLYGFGHANWNYNDKVTYLNQFWFSRSSNNTWFKYNNPVT